MVEGQRTRSKRARGMTTAETYSPGESKALLRAVFASFAARCFRKLNARTPFAPSWHHEFIVAKLEAVRGGRIRRLIINQPPRHLKSHLASVAFPAWCLGHEPCQRILCATRAYRFNPGTGEYNFAGQYQQMASPQGGGLVKAAWFRNYAPNERPEKFDRIVQSWDTANKASELSDFSICTSWGIKDKDLYLLHVLRKRMEYPELKRAVCQQCEAFDASVVLIEDKA
jgi:hypothetical protein